MSQGQIDLKWIALRESEQVEWKLSVADIESVIRTIVAFANDFSNLGGGYVVCGADETRDEYGFQKLRLEGLASDRCKELENKVLHDCRGKVSPEIAPVVIEERIPANPGKRVLIFLVCASQQAHSYRPTGKDAAAYYIRIGRETIEAKNGLLRELLVRKGALPPWDRRLNEGSTVDDIDLLLLRDTLQKMGLWDPRKPVEDYLSDSSWISAFLPSLAGKRPLEDIPRPRNFSVLLFGKNPQKAYPGAYSIFSIYRGKDRSEPTAERTELTGSIISQASKLIELLNAETQIIYDKAHPNPNQPKYPVRALQESVVNAIVHRDYEIEQPMRVTVFSDRIEIRSPGALPRAIDPEKFIAGNAPAVWRNQAFAFFFGKMQLAQGEGQGIPTILRTMNEHGCPAPRFDLEPESVTCILPAHPRHEAMRELSRIENEIILGHHQEGLSRIEKLLEADPYNFRTLELYCEVNNLLGSPERVFAFVSAKGIKPESLNPGTVVIIAETLLSAREKNQKIRPVAAAWFEWAARASLDIGEVKRIAVSFRKLKRDEEAIRVIDNFLASGDAFSGSAALLDIRAKAKMDLAKKCMDTGRSRNTPQRLRGRAWQQARDYLSSAEKDLENALLKVENDLDREYFKKDLEFLKSMKSNAERPAR
jgi:ATP-dependent DNA helicase RecG